MIDKSEAQLKLELAEWYKKCDGLDGDNPHNLALIIEYQTRALEIIGELYSLAWFDNGEAYVDRKEKHSIALENYYADTVKEKEQYAEKQTIAERRRENKAGRELKRWDKAYNSKVELIHAMKRRLEIVYEEYKRGG
jgi:hypothetical protein